MFKCVISNIEAKTQWSWGLVGVSPGISPWCILGRQRFKQQQPWRLSRKKKWRLSEERRNEKSWRRSIIPGEEWWRDKRRNRDWHREKERSGLHLHYHFQRSKVQHLKGCLWIRRLQKLGRCKIEESPWPSSNSRRLSNIYSRFSRSFTARGYLLGNPPGYKANKLYLH